jgi:hypothetical protein
VQRPIAQLGAEARLALEPGAHRRRVEDVHVEELDGDVALERDVLRAPHRAHAARPRRLDQLVPAADDRPGKERVLLGFFLFSGFLFLRFGHRSPLRSLPCPAPLTGRGPG